MRYLTIAAAFLLVGFLVAEDLNAQRRGGGGGAAVVADAVSVAVADEASVEAVAVTIVHHRCRVLIGLHQASTFTQLQVPVHSTAQVPVRLIAQVPVRSTAQVAVRLIALVVQVRFNDPRDLVL